MAQSHASAIQEAVAAHEDAAQRLKSQHAAELESERLRLAEAGEREKQAALDDVTARFTSERDLMAQSHASAIEEAAAAHEDAAQRLKSQHAAELEKERLRLVEARLWLGPQDQALLQQQPLPALVRCVSGCSPDGNGGGRGRWRGCHTQLQPQHTVRAVCCVRGEHTTAAGHA